MKRDQELKGCGNIALLQTSRMNWTKDQFFATFESKEDKPGRLTRRYGRTIKEAYEYARKSDSRPHTIKVYSVSLRMRVK